MTDKPAAPQPNLERDARRYWRLRVLGAALCESRELREGNVLRFTNLDEAVDEDIRINPSRGEAELYFAQPERLAVPPTPASKFNEMLRCAGIGPKARVFAWDADSEQYEEVSGIIIREDGDVELQTDDPE